ncbi:hypothetical protein Mapa_005360 [Marchantia paleacea]|nr:hypothetical protein Mapa_005360 [Marchantia paleacea]
MQATAMRASALSSTGRRFSTRSRRSRLCYRTATQGEHCPASRSQASRWGAAVHRLIKRWYQMENEPSSDSSHVLIMNVCPAHRPHGVGWAGAQGFGIILRPKATPFKLVERSCKFPSTYCVLSSGGSRGSQSSVPLSRYQKLR